MSKKSRVCQIWRATGLRDTATTGNQRSLHGRIRIGGKTSFTTDCRSLARDYVAGNFAWISYGSMRMHDAIWDRVFGLASHDDFHHPLPVKGNLSKHKIQHLEQTLRNFPAHVRDCSFLYVILPLLCRAASCSSSFFCLRNESSLWTWSKCSDAEIF